MILYFGLVYAISWALYFAADASTTPDPRTVLIYLGVFTPGILALAFTYRERGPDGVRSLLARLIQWDVGAMVWVCAALLGVIWAVWHLPLFFILGGDTVGQSFPFYTLQVMAISVTIAWLYMKTRGSLLLTMLLHAAINNTKDIVPSAVQGAASPWVLHASIAGWFTLAMLWLCAAWFLVDMRRDSVVADIARKP